MKLRSSKSLQEVTCTWTSPEGEVGSFKTDNRLVDFHTRMLTNNPFIKSFSFKKGNALEE